MIDTEFAYDVITFDANKYVEIYKTHVQLMYMATQENVVLPGE